MLRAKSLSFFLHSLYFSLSSLSRSITSYTYFLLAGLSYGARKHTQIRTQLPPEQREVISSVYFTSGALGAADLEYRVKSLLRQLRIRISPAPGRRSGKRADSRHVVSARAVISAVPKVTFHHGFPVHFNGYFLRPGESWRAADQGKYPETGI